MSAAAARALTALKSDNALLLTVDFRGHRQFGCCGTYLIIIEISTWRFLWQMESLGCRGARDERYLGLVTSRYGFSSLAGSLLNLVIPFLG